MKKTWKKMLAVLMAMMVLMVPFGAMAEQADDGAEFYELSAENTVLTVRLPANAGTGITWDYEISNPEVLELLTMEVVEDNPDGLVGAPITFVASFRGIGAGDVSLIMRACRAGEDAAVSTKVLELKVNEEYEIAVASVLEREDYADWAEVDDVTCLITVRMEGEWSFEILDPAKLELATMEVTEDGQFVASFTSTMEEAGMTQIVFESEDGLNQRALDVFVNEGGYLFNEGGEIFRILIPAE